MPVDRRGFLQLLSAGALSAAFPASIARALEIPAYRRTGTIADIQHIVILMQENRSFDHYFGSMNGVRGFGDPRAVLLPNGKSVWYQPDSTAHADGHVLPFHPPAPDLGLQFLEDLDHGWTKTHEAWNNGHHDGWVAKKGSTTMAHLTRNDIPYHYALADAFTVCDAYHCSLMGPTDPNRYYMFSGWVGNDGEGGGPVVDNAEAGYGWKTFPERLHEAGVSWKLYQDIGNGISAKDDWGQTKDPYVGNYGDNSLLFFKQFENAPPGTPLHAAAKTGTQVGAKPGALVGNQPDLFSQFRKDVLSGNLPQVSWVVAPEAYSEHPNWPANYGAWYISQVLDALTADPEIWSKTALLITYDENDGFFDHMPPLTVPPTEAHGRSTVDMVHEIFPGSKDYAPGPYGMGIRVPMLVVSPWSKGGWVNSEVFDHSSLIRLIERRFQMDAGDLHEPNITPWRRAVAGDLTSAFNFATPNDATVPLPSTVAYRPLDTQRHPDYKPTPPESQAMPHQEPGTRPMRALPYVLAVQETAQPGDGAFGLRFMNSGRAAAVFQVRSQTATGGPWTYTVEPGAELDGEWTLPAGGAAHDLAVYGPSGFYRRYAGGSELSVEGHADPDRYVFTVAVANTGQAEQPLRLVDGYSGKTHTHTLKPGQKVQLEQKLNDTHGWYDVAVETDPTSAGHGFARQMAGHVENGGDSRTDPKLGEAGA